MGCCGKHGQHGSGQHGSGQQCAGSHPPAARACPVCGQPVDDSCPTLEYQGTTYTFRCPHCVEAFRHDPERYLARV